MRLSIVVFSLSGGAGVVARNLALYAARQGVAVNIVCASADPHLASSLEGRVEVLGGRRLARFAVRMALHHRLLARRVIVFDPLLAGLLTPWLRLCDRRRKMAVRILTDPAQIIHQTRSRFARWAKRRAFWYGRRYADLLIANSQGSLESFFEECSAASRLPAEVIYNPVVGLDEPAVVDRANFAARLAVTEPVPIIAAAGRLVDQKGFDLLILAVARLVREGFADFHVVVFGDGPNRHELERAVRDNGLGGVVLFFGGVPDLRAYLPVCDLFVLSSRYEGFGNVLVEALDAGLPVVAFNCPSGPTEILCGGKYGELVPPGNVGALAEVLGGWLTAGAANCSERQRQRAIDFHVDVVGAKYLKVLQEM